MRLHEHEDFAAFVTAAAAAALDVERSYEHMCFRAAVVMRLLAREEEVWPGRRR